jgi:D-amino peptidase
MKLFISSDIEGTCGIAHWDETTKEKPDYKYFQEQMTAEAAAACKGALAGGASEVFLKDAHETGRNIIPSKLPRGVTLNRSFGGDIFCMVSGLDDSFGGLAFTGYHSPGGGNGNLLSHTMNTLADEIKINGERASEFTIHSYIAAYLGVPILFLSGDEELCRLAKRFVPGIRTVPTLRGDGNSSWSPHPDEATEKIKSEVEAAVDSAVKTGAPDCVLKLPDSFEISVRYQNHIRAYRNAWYPGAKLDDEKTVVFSSKNYIDVLKFFHFCL